MNIKEYRKKKLQSKTKERGRKWNWRKNMIKIYKEKINHDQSREEEKGKGEIKENKKKWKQKYYKRRKTI